MNLRKQIEDKHSSELIAFIKEYEAMEDTGVFPNGPLREMAEQHIESNNGFQFQSPLIVARDIAFECYRHIANICIVRH